MSAERLAILVTGGTGSFGRKFIASALKNLNPSAVRVYSRDELKQHDMQRDPSFQDERLRFLIGDVRDQSRLQRAMEGVDLVVHAAALKQVPVCEYNPFEAVKTNVLGAQNVIESALNLEVPRVIAVSTDKAVNPVNLYGATKLCAEKMFTAANAYVGSKNIRISCVRYGNVVGSRGSVVPLFLAQRHTGRITITDKRMTRFWITLEQAVDFVSGCIGRMRGGEIFVPKIPSTMLLDLAAVAAPNAEIRVTGIRPGEKIHEVLLTEDEARVAREYDTYFVIEPKYPGSGERQYVGGASLPDGFRYASDTNPSRLSREQLCKMVAEIEADLGLASLGSHAVPFVAAGPVVERT